MKEVFRQIIFGITILIILSIIFFMVNAIKDNLDESQEILERCQDKGWDGIKIKGGFSTELICANMSQAEKDALESKAEVKK